MTDLTTMHLKCLLEKAAPGPWESSAVVDALCKDWDSYLLHLYMGNTCLSQVSSVQYEDESYESLNLAALAPELAQEVIRLREELRDLRDQLKKKAEYHSKVELSTDPLDGIELEDNYAEDEISRILGDHGE